MRNKFIVISISKKMTLVSYVLKNNRCSILLSTMRNDDVKDISTGVTSMITSYNRTTWAADVVHELSTAYSTARINNMCSIVIFFSMLNTAAINFRVLLLTTNKPEEKNRTRGLLLKDLGVGLLKVKIQGRSVQHFITQNCRTN